MQFQLLLKNETGESVYKDNDTNNKFNSFLSTFLNTFEASFPMKYKSIGKLRMTGLHKEYKYLANIKGVYISTVGTVMTQTQEHFTSSIVKS
jgi:hypothetical protein